LKTIRSPGPYKLFLSVNQKEISEFLSEQSPALNDLYLAVVRMVGDSGYTQHAKARLINHACREICNRLPDLICGEQISRGIKYKEEIDCIIKEWDKEKPVAKNIFGDDINDGREQVLISYALLNQINDLFIKHKSVQKIREKRARAISEYAFKNIESRETTQPLVKQLKDLTGWFSGRAHESLENKNSNMLYEKTLKRFSTLESTLHSLGGHYYSGHDEIRKFVEKVNSNTEEPDKVTIGHAVALLGKPQYLGYFFKNLKKS
jgi:hypothetical protein